MSPKPQLRGPRSAEQAAAAWLAAGVYACLIFAVSSITRIPVPPKLQLIHADWIFHMLEYSVFGFLLVRALGLSFEFPSALALAAVAFAAGACYATSDEFHQRFVAGRTSSLGDGLADAVGLVFGIAAWFRRIKINQGKQNV